MIADKEFSKMEFNPFKKVDSKLKSILGGTDEKMMKYVLLMYDVNSPLRQFYPELSKRKEFAASMAGYDLMKENVTVLFDFKDGDTPNEELLSMVINYLKYQNNWVWSMIVSNSEAFYEYNKRVMMPVEGNKDKDILQAINIKTQIMESQDQIYQRLQRYYKELSGGDDLLEEALTKRKRISPESVATR